MVFACKWWKIKLNRSNEHVVHGRNRYLREKKISEI